MVKLASFSFLLFLSVEFALRIFYLLKHRKFLFWTPTNWGHKTVVKAYKSHHVQNYCKVRNIKTDFMITNNLGYVGGEAIGERQPDEIRVFILGGSTVEQNDFDRKKPFNVEMTWPQNLQKLLRQEIKDKVTVINGGVAGYTSIESNIEFQVNGIFQNPTYAIFYHSINDAWFSQSIASFRSDYSHIRKSARFPEEFLVPEIRCSFIYQSIVRRLLLMKNTLANYTMREYPYTTDLENIEYKASIFKRYVKNFCGVCLIHGIKPILIPWTFPEKPANYLPGHIISDVHFSKFLDLLKANNRVIREVALEIGAVDILDFGDHLPRNYYRDPDWIHWSQDGLVNFANLVFEKLMPIIKRHDKK